MTFREMIRNASCAVMDDGVVSLGETTVLLRLIRPFVGQGNPGAIRLQELLNRVRADGRITPDESEEIHQTLNRLANEPAPSSTRPIVTMPSANGKGYIIIEKVLDSELKDKCGLYALVTIPAGAELGFHEHHGEGESYFILNGEGIYNDNGEKRCVRPGDSTWTPSGSGHGLDNSRGRSDLVFMALIVKD